MVTGKVPFAYLVKLHTWKDDPKAKKVELEIILEEVVCDNHEAINDLLGKHFPVFEAARDIVELDTQPVGPQAIMIMGHLVFITYDTPCGTEHDVMVDVDAHQHWDIPVDQFNKLVDSTNAAHKPEDENFTFI
ncbi:hypothetical protein PJWF_00062 [Achromobacter phage JWF]|uniref:hypothetical protein n=1 Tax=Achromobacter phage JWF TaxID=1589748 RepID=UPI000588E7EC|nr:hypothetical protein AXJ13_gp062 [Achromobacter phage JWF]AJD82956.1 hypothetical protein PJWF_00062 [Achromobacter phage JWF]